MNVRLALFAAASCLSTLPVSSFAHLTDPRVDRRDCYPAFAGRQSICPGNTVQSRTNHANIGRVRTIFSNGDVMVEMLSGFNIGTVQSYSASNLAVEVQEMFGFVAGLKVMSKTNNENTGTVRHVFESASAIVTMETGFNRGTSQDYELSNLGRSVSRLGEISINDLVMSRTNSANTGIVVALFDNGVAQVQMRSGFKVGTIQAYEVRNLAVSLGGGHRPGPVGPGHGGPGPVGPGPIVIPGPIVTPGPVGPGPVTCTVVTSRRIPHVGRGMTQDEAGRNARLACISVERNPLACNRESTISCSIGRRF